MSEQATQEAAAADLERRALLPGTRVEVPECQITVIVHPVGWRQFIKSTSSFGSVIGAVLKSAPSIARSGASPSELGSVAIGSIMPFVTEELLSLIEACLIIEPKGATLDDVPHWRVAEIVEAWTEESFGSEKKWRPWLTAIEKTVSAFAGRFVSIKEMLSKLS